MLFRSIKDLQRFLGLMNFYRRFIPRAAAILLPLTDALVGNPKDLCWTTEMAAAFQAAKLALIKSIKLVHPQPSAQLSLATDASNTHISANSWCKTTGGH